jgi:prepilin-type N-terminal cleavage/methylation domain-containing protein
LTGDRLNNMPTSSIIASTPDSLRAASAERSRSAFTLMELLVVMSIIVLLSAMALGMLFRVRRQSDVGATRALLMTLTAAAQQYHQAMLQWPHSGRGLVRPWMWDLDGDGVLDDQTDPGLTVSFPGYTGILRMATGGAVPAWSVRTGIIRDRWAQRIRVAAPLSYASLSGAPGLPPAHCVLPDPPRFGVYSCGPDRIDQTDPLVPSGDDIRSW